MRYIYLFAFGGLFIASPCLNAYEYATHMLTTDYAYRDSTLNPQSTNSIVPLIGFDRLDKNYPFAFTGVQADVLYFDEQAVTNPAVTLPADMPYNYQRAPQKQELNFLDSLVLHGYVPGDSGAAIEQQVRAWLMRGDVREDDNDFIRPVIGGWTNRDQRDDDPYGPILRAVKHFYDPIWNRALEFPECGDYTCLPSINWSLGRTSPLSPASDSDDPDRRNHFTWQDARNNYWWALTLERIDPVTLTFQGKAMESSQERLERWATTIHDLGHVIHLLQDAAQPQHVRNDGHGPPLVASLYPREGAADAAFEEYTEYRVTRDNAAANAQNIRAGGNSLLQMDEDVPTLNALPPVTMGDANYYPGNGGKVQFSTPVKFFTTRHIESAGDDATVLTRRGLADFANHSFFTSGTLPGFKECRPVGDTDCTPMSTYTYTLPPNDLTSGGYTETQFDIGLRVNSRTVFLGQYSYPITDKVSPNYDAALGELNSNGGKAPLVTKTIWSDVIPDDLRPSYIQTVGYTISYNNMRYMADVMLPRAVGYSAGLIDFFFRGRIKVEAPADGLFGLVDHALPHTVDASGYPHCDTTVPGASGEPDFCDANQIYGFTKIRLKIRNDTPDITESGTTGPAIPQTLSTTSATPGPADPRLVAVARYHRNLCYTSLLAGEAVVDYQGNTTENDCPAGNRTGYQEIAVSKPLAITAANLNGSTSYAVAFDFSSDPIPINATDLFIQVVYRGPLGDEPDGIAVGRIDVSEPTYLTLWNNSDYAGCNGAWVTGNSPGCSYSNGSIGKGIDTAYLCIGHQSVYSRYNTGGNGNIYLGKYIRVAALLDDQPHLFRGNLVVGTESLAVHISKSITGTTRQDAMEIETMQNPYVPETMYAKRGFIGNFRPMPFYLTIGTDPQPANDMGALDVGALTPQSMGTGVAPTTGGTVNFPNTPPNPVPACQ
jgi:hypothetical protein